MPLVKLQFKPGIVHDVSSYTNTGGWYDCNLVRFRFGLPQSFGGWEKYSTQSFIGTCRSLHNWITLRGENLLSVGTHIKFYIEEGGFFYDVTPIRETATLANPFTATTGSNLILVTDTNHGAEAGSYVTISGSASLGGNVTAAELNKNHEVLSVVDVNSYCIQVGVTANASDTGKGGATVTFNYEITPGLDTEVGGGGWGAGGWSRDTWGSGITLTTASELRVWRQDNFGEDLIANIQNGQIYYWDATSGLTARMVTLESLSSDTTVPTVATQVLISDKDRHVIALGCDNGDGVQDPLLIRFSDMENPFIWENLPTNTAGELRLGTGSYIVCGVETKREIVVFTDATMYSMQYLGPPDTFGIQQIAGKTTIVSSRAAVAVEDSIFWMSHHGFSVYAGTIVELDCPVRDYVFNDFNHGEPSKVFAAHNPNSGEVMWFYCSENALNNDRYVVYNYREQNWYYGRLARTAWSSSTLREYPIGACCITGYLFNHEYGNDADGQPMNAYIESSPVELGNGDQFMLVSRIIPDVTFEGSDVAAPSITYTIKTSRFPGSNYNYTTTTTTTTTTQTTTIPVEQFTEYTDVRLRGRQMVLRAEKNALGVSFTVGVPRVEVRPDGRR